MDPLEAAYVIAKHCGEQENCRDCIFYCEYKTVGNYVCIFERSKGPYSWPVRKQEISSPYELY